MRERSPAFGGVPARLGALLILALLATAPGPCPPAEPVVHTAALGELTLRYELVSRERATRTEFVYGFAATLENGFGADLGALRLRVSGGGPGTELLSHELRFGALPAGDSARAAAPLRIRQDRTQPFRPGALAFELRDVGVPLRSIRPAGGAAEVAPTEWPLLEFEGPPAEAGLAGLAVSCDGTAVPFARHALGGGRLVLNPAPALPAGAECTLAWPGAGGIESRSFHTAAAPGAAATVRYDRSDPSRTAPFPDDLWLEPDASTPTGRRVDFPVPFRSPDVENVYGQLFGAAENAAVVDGWSPVGAFVVELSEAPDPASFPRNAAASLAPLASIRLLDLTAGTESFGERVPFRTYLRSVRTSDTDFQHALMIYPSVPLRPRGRYGLVVTNRVRTESGAPFRASEFFATAAGAPEPGEDAAVAEVRPLADEVLEVAADRGLPVPREDAALALRASIRSTEGFQRDVLAIRQELFSRPPPEFTVTSVREATASDVAAIVEGTFQLPEWRDGPVLARDAEDRPRIVEVREHPFTLALPESALDAPAPVTMYQHGNPGTAAMGVPRQARSYLGEAGFAVIGFTDTLNSEIGPSRQNQLLAVFAPILLNGLLPDLWMQTRAGQLAMLRLIEGLGTLDVLPVGAPDGQPELDPSLPLTYVGISEGANNGTGFLPYAPEIRAGALVVGGGRLGEILFFQDEVGTGGVGTTTLDLVDDFVPNVRPLDLWIGYQLFQLAFDPQESHIHGTFLYRDPVEVAGTRRKPSVLLTEGLADTEVPNNVTRSLAFGMGPVPHLRPIARAVPFLEERSGPVRANVDAETTAAFDQFVPDFLDDLPPTPGCRFEAEGHFCAQTAEEAVRQRVRFLETALSDTAPEVIDPF